MKNTFFAQVGGDQFLFFRQTLKKQRALVDMSARSADDMYAEARAAAGF